MYYSTFLVYVIVMVSFCPLPIYPMEQDLDSSAETGTQRRSRTIVDMTYLEAEVSTLASHSSPRSDSSFPSRPPSEQVSVPIENFGREMLQDVQISADDIMRHVNTPMPESCRLLVQEKINTLKIDDPARYIALTAAISSKRGSSNDSQDVTTLFLLDVLGRGVESYKSDLREEAGRSQGQRKTIGRQKAITTGSIVAALASGTATIASAAITAYFAANKNC